MPDDFNPTALDEVPKEINEPVVAETKLEDIAIKDKPISPKPPALDPEDNND